MTNIKTVGESMSSNQHKNGRFRVVVVGLLGFMLLLNGGCAALFHQPQKKPTMAYAKPRTLTQKKQEPQSWLGRTFDPEPEKPKTVLDWMGKTKQINPAGEDDPKGE
jgi:hypothetical protein